MGRSFAVCVLIALIFIAGAPFTKTSEAASASHLAVAAGTTDLAFDLYGELGSKEENVFFSPYSVASAVGMTYAGARGETATEMRKALHFQLEQAGLNSAFKSLNEKLLHAAHEAGQTLGIANALVLTGGKVRASYMNLLGKYYDAEIFGGDLSAINTWVNKKTEGKIDSILEKLSPNSTCDILNAVYFKGIWDREFEKKNTRDEAFHRPRSSNEIKVPIMHRKDMYKLLDADAMQVISLPYKGKALSMVIILPKAIDGLPSIEKNLDAQAMRELFIKLDKQPERKVSLYFPKFRMESSYDLSGTFQTLGMKDAFSPAADFGGMGWSKGNLRIGQIRQRAFVEVNEEGTQAAAATAVDMTEKAEAVKEMQFRADHPFLFVIRDNETGTILFMGRMINPA